MADDTTPGELSADEAAFFDSKGETAPAESAPAPESVKEEPAKSLAVPVKEEIAETEEEEAEPTHKTGDLSKAVVAKNRELSQLKARLRESETKEATLNGRLSILERLARGLPATDEPQKPAVIDPDTDPLGAVKSTFQKVTELENQLAQRTQQEQATQHERQFVDAYQRGAQEFAKTNNEFFDAYSHLVNGRVAELQLIGHDQQMVAQIVAAEEKMIINTAIAQGKDPYQSIYDVAKLRGFSKAPSVEPPKTDDTAKVVSMQKAEKATKTLSNAPGAASATPTLDALANMSEDEFAEATAGKNWRKLFGA